MRGDKVVVLIDTGAGRAERFEVVASKDGRKLEVTTSAREITVVEQTRSGRDIRTCRFQRDRALAVMEHPASELTPTQNRRKPAVTSGQLDLSGKEGAA